MKRPFTIYDLRFTIWKKSGRAVSPLTADAHGVTRSAVPNHQSSIINHKSQSGVALVITLILLAVVTFMALTFLAISRRERGAVTTSTDNASARLAADDALASAEGQIVANLLANNNPFNFSLLVSTNYINPNGFQNAGPGYASYTNVNYYYPNGSPVVGPDFLQLMANLYYLPRVPVYMSNLVTRTMENRFYLDLNRNGLDDANGWVPELGNNGLPIVNGVVTNYVYETGDPEWVGVLQHPDQPYGPNNLVVARYAFFAVPIGNALDLNHIFNQVLDESEQFGTVGKGVSINPSARYGPNNDAFLRNQGVGSWEINLAAFLADLNTNRWDSNLPGRGGVYQYRQANTPALPNIGAAFNDARALLSYRYQNNYLSLKRAGLLFPNMPAPNTGPFPFDNIDSYSDGPLQTTPLPINEVTLFGNRDNPIVSWSGAPNTNGFFDMQELFNTNETEPVFIVTPPGFTDRLLEANNGLSTYDRYTYYRLLSQMGVESAPEQGKLNLNYMNVDTNGNVVPDMQTNLIPWTNAMQFFTNAADRMLRDYSQEWLVESPSNYLATYGSFTNISTAASPLLNPTNMPTPFGISDIPVYVYGRPVYTPAIQRVLQLAANIYDATTNNAAVLGANFPSVFRPTFWVTNEYGFTNVYINGYEPVQALVNGIQQIGAVTGTGDPQLNLPVDVTAVAQTFGFGSFTNINVYGVPWIIGAKKGFPNFNEYAMESTFQLTRKLQVTRPGTNSPISAYQYNQMFNVSMTNQFGVECWNSYTNDYLRSVAIYVTCTNACLLTNDEDFSTNLASLISGYLAIDSTSNNNNGWPGYNPQSSGTAVFLTPASFQIPLNTNIVGIPTSMYRFNVGGNLEEPGYTGPYLTTNLNFPWGNSLFESGVTWNGRSYPQPHWFLTAKNDTRVIILDTQTGPPYHIIDYVQLSGPNTNIDLTSQIIANFDTTPGPSGSDFWNTNIQNNLPIGLISQIGVSLGSYPPAVGYGAWAAGSDTQRENEIDGFRAFFNYSLLHPNNLGESEAVAEARMTNNIQVPYTPTAALVQEVDWQVNDPLVHYMADDLQGAPRNGRILPILPNQPSGDWPSILGALNDRYSPWGGHQPINTNAPDPNAINAYNLALKDPLVYSSDDWDFPTYKFPSVGWLGRVHRGTPWQTVYLKSPDILQQTQVSGVTTNYIGTNSWLTWTGNGNSIDAANAAPAQDRLLFDVFSTALNDNATRGQLSVNVDAGNPSPQAGLAAWSALFSGVLVLSNNAVDAAVNPAVVAAQHNGSLQDFTPFPINPAGSAGSNSPMGRLVAGINQTRTKFVNPDGLTGSFEHVGDVLAVPQMAWQSPFLNWSDIVQQENGISDELYEWLPEQVMSLLRVSDTPSYVIYSYGQALKPAPNGIYTGGGAFFGMVTNYQVVAEAATRAVVRFNGTRVDVLSNDVENGSWIVVPSTTNNTAVIEQFNVLPSN